jgi:hypothetical protein
MLDARSAAGAVRTMALVITALVGAAHGETLGSAGTTRGPVSLTGEAVGECKALLAESYRGVRGGIKVTSNGVALEGMASFTEPCKFRLKGLTAAVAKGQMSHSDYIISRQEYDTTIAGGSLLEMAEGELLLTHPGTRVKNTSASDVKLGWWTIGPFTEVQNRGGMFQIVGYHPAEGATDATDNSYGKLTLDQDVFRIDYVGHKNPNGKISMTASGALKIREQSIGFEIDSSGRYVFPENLVGTTFELAGAYYTIGKNRRIAFGAQCKDAPTPCSGFVDREVRMGASVTWLTETHGLEHAENVSDGELAPGTLCPIGFSTTKTLGLPGLTVGRERCAERIKGLTVDAHGDLFFSPAQRDRKNNYRLRSGGRDYTLRSDGHFRD